MDSIFRLIAKPKFYIYLKLNKEAVSLLPMIYRTPKYCVMCFINERRPAHHKNLEKRLNFINRNGAGHTADSLCMDCASPSKILYAIYHYNEVEVFNKALTYCCPKNLNHYIIKKYLAGTDQYRHILCCKQNQCSKIIYLINNSDPADYVWELSWPHEYIPLLVSKGNRVDTSNCIYEFVVDYYRYSTNDIDEFNQILESQNVMFDKILNLDYLGDSGRIIAVLHISNIIEIKVDEKSNLGKLLTMLQI
jgi:hypothetical protein